MCALYTGEGGRRVGESRVSNVSTTGSSCVQSGSSMPQRKLLHGQLWRGSPPTWPEVLHLGHLRAKFAECCWAGLCVWPPFSQQLQKVLGLPQTQGEVLAATPLSPAKKIVKNEYKTCQSEKNCISKLVSLGQAFLWGKWTIQEIMKMTACLFSCKIFQQACTVNPALLSPFPLFLSV